ADAFLSLGCFRPVVPSRDDVDHAPVRAADEAADVQGGMIPWRTSPASSVPRRLRGQGPLTRKDFTDRGFDDRSAHPTLATPNPSRTTSMDIPSYTTALIVGAGEGLSASLA